MKNQISRTEPGRNICILSTGIRLSIYASLADPSIFTGKNKFMEHPCVFMSLYSGQVRSLNITHVIILPHADSCLNSKQLSAFLENDLSIAKKVNKRICHKLNFLP